MPTTTDDIKSVHRRIRSLFDREKRNGFRSHAIEEAATDAVLSFEAFVSNPHRPDLKEWARRGARNLERALKQ
jgi:hypothetical protein